MGYHKDRLIEDGESGLKSGAADGKFVCADCFTDSSLQSVVERDTACDICTFCGAQSDEWISAPLESVMAHIVQCLRLHYDDAANCLPYESAEGGYLGDIFDSWEVLDHAGIQDCLADGREHLLDAIRNSLEDAAWCKRNPFELRQHEQLSFSWERFCDFIKHERRFFFLGARPPYSERDGADQLLTPADILAVLAEQCRRHELIVPIAAGARLFRVRKQEPGPLFTAPLDLGPPPPAGAKQNRMSPAGVAMTYLAEDETTALAETVCSDGTSKGNAFAVGEFELTKKIFVLDFTAVPKVPSIFDLDRAAERDAIIFLREFVAEVSKPIEHDDRIHIDYVPTQVVTEYLRWSPELQERRLRGLRYRSSQGDGVCLVIFAGREVLALSDEDRDKLVPLERRQPRTSACLHLVRSHQVAASSKRRRNR